MSSVFDLFVDDYDRWFDTSEGRVLFETEIEAVRLLMRDIERPLLEVGVGTGRFASELGIEFGVDPSVKMLKIAEKRGIKTELASGESLPFKDSTFGGVFILFTLCFVESPETVINEARRVLRSGGRLIIGIISRESPWGQIYLYKKGKGHPIYKHAHFYTPSEMTEMIEKAGMTVEGYSSTLCQSTSERLYRERAHNELMKEAGFVCILARKS